MQSLSSEPHFFSNFPGQKQTEDHRPREKLTSLGVTNLADHELLAVLLGTGTKGHSISQVARRLTALIDETKDELSLDLLQQIDGIGPAKAMIVLSALEFSRRRMQNTHTRIRRPEDIIPLVSHMADRRQEHLISITLNGAHEVITSRIISVGTANSAVAHPREIFQGAIVDGACAIALAHNHPSGNVEPSEDDKAVTRRVAEAGKLLGITLIDHVIFGRSGFFSFKTAGLI